MTFIILLPTCGWCNVTGASRYSCTHFPALLEGDRRWRAEMDLFPLRLLLSRCFITAMEQEIKTSFPQSCHFIKSVGKVFSVKGLELITGTMRILKLHRCSLLSEWDSVFTPERVLQALGLGAATQNCGSWREETTKLTDSASLMII